MGQDIVLDGIDDQRTADVTSVVILGKNQVLSNDIAVLLIEVQLDSDPPAVLRIIQPAQMFPNDAASVWQNNREIRVAPVDSGNTVFV